MTWYATREAVRGALSSASTARDDAQIDRALRGATTAVSELCQRDFAPVLATRYFNWPNEQTSRSWRLWLDRNELLAATQVMSGGTLIPPTDFYLEPANYGPPYSSVEIRLDRQSAWTMGSTHQRAIGITGWYAGAPDVQEPAGQLAASIDATTTSVTVSNSRAVGVGNLLAAGAERMLVTDKGLVDTGQTLQTPVAAKKDEVLFSVSDGTAYYRGEVLTLGSERALVRDVLGDTLVVERAIDGSVLDSHSGTPIWAPRMLTVQRAASGTTAVSAASGTAVTRWVPPGLVEALAVAEAMCTLLSEQAGYARTVRAQAGTSGTRSVAAVTAERTALRAQVAQALGRKARTRVV